MVRKAKEKDSEQKAIETAVSVLDNVEVKPGKSTEEITRRERAEDSGPEYTEQ